MKQKTQTNKKSIIETFQNLFKTSSNKKNHSNIKLNNNNNNNNDVESTITNEHLPVNNKQQTIELINYQRKNFDETNFKKYFI